VVSDLVTPSHVREAHMTTPPNFGGRSIGEGLDEDLGAPPPEHSIQSEQDHERDEERLSEYTSEWGSNEAHAPGQACARCGAAISPGQDVRRRADGTWVHEICPA
jgi:hypothetical protein